MRKTHKQKVKLARKHFSKKTTPFGGIFGTKFWRNRANEIRRKELSKR